jgi:hypothetical protein
MEFLARTRKTFKNDIDTFHEIESQYTEMQLFVTLSKMIFTK